MTITMVMEGNSLAVGFVINLLGSIPLLLFLVDIVNVFVYRLPTHSWR